MRPERPVGQGVELLKHVIVFVNEALVGGVVQSSRARNLKAFRRDQEIGFIDCAEPRPRDGFAPDAWLIGHGADLLRTYWS